MRPTVGALAGELYTSLTPFTTTDEALGWPLLLYTAALTAPGEDIASIVRDTDTGPGWSALVDADRCPTWALPWLAQVAGVTLTPKLDAAQQRALIKLEPARARGSLAAIVAAAQRRLTGDKRVIVRERDGGAYKLTVITITSETPDAAGTEADVRAAKPAGLLLTYETSTGHDFEYLRTTRTDFDAVSGAYTTFNDLKAS